MNWNTAAFDEFPYGIAHKNHFWTEHPEFDKKSGAEFAKLFRQGIENGKLVERDIRQCIQKWPHVAGFQWMLAEYYSYHDEDAAYEVIDALIDNHPESIFAAIAQLGRCIIDDEEPPTFFGLEDSLELHELFPDRVLFHAYEVFLYETSVFLLSFDLTAGECALERHARCRNLSTTMVFANQIALLTEVIFEKHNKTAHEGPLLMEEDEDAWDED